MEEEIRELYEALEERERNIDELEAVLTNLEAENDKQQDELNARTKELQELQLRSNSSAKTTVGIAG